MCNSDAPGVKKASASPNDPFDGDNPFYSAESGTTGMMNQPDVSRYFNTMSAMQEAIRVRDYSRAAELAKLNMRQAARWLEVERGLGQIVPPSIPALEAGGLMLALTDDADALREMRRIVESIPELRGRIADVDRHEEDRTLIAAIEQAIEQNAGILQNRIKTVLPEKDSPRVSTLISWLEKAGRIVRKPVGKTYALYVPSAVPRAMQGERTDVPATPVGSHRIGQGNLVIRELQIDVNKTPYVRLPRAPLQWEEVDAGRRPPIIPEPEDFFGIVDAANWQLGAIEKIPMTERPDIAYRTLEPLDTGLLLIDDLGKSVTALENGAPASALHFDRSGSLSASCSLHHDIYRLGANPLGHGFIAMSRNCVVHAYDDDLHRILETSLLHAPEVKNLSRRMHTPTQSSDALKTHIRCVALGFDNSRYLTTGVDEAWCVDVTGAPRWGVRMPKKEGWQVLGTTSEMYGTSAEITAALEVLGLALPFEADDVRRRYRTLAREIHPDVNPGKPNAAAQMTRLNLAAELLSGMTSSDLTDLVAGGVYAQEIERSEINVDGMRLSVTVSMQGGEAQASDWIYAAGLGGLNHHAYLAAYSGRVVVLDATGSLLRVYDVGNVPRRIVDTGDFVYLLTDTRLYVLKDQRLFAIVDTFGGGELVMGQTGFGLLESKRFRWFREDGVHLGSVIAKEPIRRVYSKPEGLVVESRQRRVVVKGAPNWWESAS